MSSYITDAMVLEELTKTVEVQTTTMSDLMDICTMLKDRIEILEEKAKR